MIHTIDTLLAGGGYDALPLANLPNPGELVTFVEGSLGRGLDHDPRWERNLNTGESTYESSRTEVARQTIFHDAGRPSRITLTVVEE